MKDISQQPDLPEILLVDKPVGISSYDVIRELKKQFPTSKFGHAGTLDPLASGLLIIGVDKGTKRMEEFLKLPKVYEAEILLGKRTDTGDLEGKVLDEQSIAGVNEYEILKALQEITGTHSYQVPLYSAIKVDGKPLYKYARLGKTPPRIPEKEMTVREVELVDHFADGDTHRVQVIFDVASGTYIRTLAEAFGRAMGYPAMLSSLRRTSIGGYTILDSYRLDDIRKLS